MPKFLLLGSVSFRKVFKFKAISFCLSVNLKTILSVDIAFEYNIQDTAEKMETGPETTAIAMAMDNMTAVYEPEGEN